MGNIEPGRDTSKREREFLRSLDDAKTSNAFGRAAAQSAILINGGAATAVLAFLANVLHEKSAAGVGAVLVKCVSAALAVYAIGVFAAAIGLIVASWSIELYLEGHGHAADGKSADKTFDEALIWWKRFIWSIFVSLLCFVVSSVTLSITLGFSF